MLYRQGRAQAREVLLPSIERRRGAGPWQGDGDGARARDEAEARLRLREAECGVVLDEHAAAIGSIEAVPVELRPAKATRYSASSILQSGLKRNAITAESALDKDPLCLEVVEPLQRLKASQQDFERTTPWIRPMKSTAWLTAFAEAHQALAQHDPTRAANAWSDVEQRGDFHGTCMGYVGGAVAARRRATTRRLELLSRERGPRTR